jgi:hypothetical protein
MSVQISQKISLAGLHLLMGATHRQLDQGFPYKEGKRIKNRNKNLVRVTHLTLSYIY